MGDRNRPGGAGRVRAGRVAPVSAASILAPPRAFLDVSASVLGRTWRDRCADAALQADAATMTQAHGLPDLLARVLAGRGIRPAQAQAHLQPRLRDLMPDPSCLVDMGPAVERLARACRTGETVAIFGDYDVDGAASASLLAGYLRHLGVEARIHIPDRITEGYGPNVGAVTDLAQAGATLLVTVDCGTAGHAPFEAAARLGLDVVVLDHHGAPEHLPQARAIVNPNRLDDLSGLGHLCAAGVVFLTLVALNRFLRGAGMPATRLPDLQDGLDLVALATVADVVPLHGLNRAFVVQGLTVMRARGRLGLAALLDAAALTEPPEAWHLGYLLGPRINAGGRIGDASLGARLLLTRDGAEATRIAAELDRLNRERQVVEAQAVDEAEAEMDRALGLDPDQPVLVTGSADWHPGIVGLIAARLKERFGRPAFAFAFRPDGSAVGSGRSIAGADLGEAVRTAVAAAIAVKGGGHAMAAGVTMAGTDLARLRDHLRDRLGTAVAQARTVDALLLDGTVSAGGATAEMVRTIQRAGPFGQGAPEPVFALPRHRIVDAGIVGTGHVRSRLRSRDGQTIGAISFRAAQGPLGQAILQGIGQEFHVAGTLSCDRWRGTERAQVRICDLSPAADANRYG
ncbi:single-stranded-DNA-specific exonuclease RecJ [Methylobacterium sp. Leaf399]|uniref:single-stranded-DNA-specific exonuclease RecJ n=1 Tax=unclassified Methylobacterium TaxID=2615210 RepID=UPI0006FD3637|nr:MULTISPECIES: single-stranded-DNA-specific exonuclease RecJ [unclassified Methylobacterium]KQT15385.1 single-stranded-DNA-specific exonuclease RecJ [Methylobacterium sp. Leaf399]KQT78623.1 single-stranded-DNA-specific exonuclease RecJ [Methylobacterium sp. Leaf466]